MNKWTEDKLAEGYSRDDALKANSFLGYLLQRKITSVVLSDGSAKTQLDEMEKRMEEWKNLDEEGRMREKADLFNSQMILYELQLQSRPSCEEEKVEAFYGLINPLCEWVDTQQLASVLQTQRSLCAYLEEPNWKTAVQKVYCTAVQEMVGGLELEEVKSLLQNATLPLKVPTRNPPAKEDQVANVGRAYALLLERVGEKSSITVKFLCEIHDQVYQGEDSAGKCKGEQELDLKLLMNWVESAYSDQKLDRIALATLTHLLLGAIQPFHYGNGRICRLMQDYILLCSGFPPIDIFPTASPHIDMTEAMDKASDECLGLSLEQRLTSRDPRPFIRNMTEALEQTMKRWLKLVSESQQCGGTGPSGSVEADRTARQSHKALLPIDDRASYNAPPTKRIQEHSTIGATTPVSEAEKLREESSSQPPTNIIVASIKEAIADLNPNLLHYHVLEREEPEKPVRTGPFGWALLFQEAIQELNPNLLHYDA